jgi:hypothetical protein
METVRRNHMGTGSVVAKVYTSDSEIPQMYAAVGITRKDSGNGRELIAFRLTNMDGLTEAITLETPDESVSQNYSPGKVTFSIVDIIAEQVGYDRVAVKNVQIFPNVQSRQDFELIPTAELPDFYDRTEVFNITAQNL